MINTAPPIASLAVVCQFVWSIQIPLQWFPFAHQLLSFPIVPPNIRTKPIPIRNFYKQISSQRIKRQVRKLLQCKFEKNKDFFQLPHSEFVKASAGSAACDGVMYEVILSAPNKIFCFSLPFRIFNILLFTRDETSFLLLLLSAFQCLLLNFISIILRNINYLFKFTFTILWL